MSAARLLADLAELGVQASTTPEGNLRLEPASRVPADLLADLRTHKAEVLEQLEQGGVHSVDSPARPSIPDPFEVGAQPGHCACCAHWTKDPDARYLGQCALGWAAHFPAETWKGRTPVETTAHHACAANGGAGWRAR